MSSSTVERQTINIARAGIVEIHETLGAIKGSLKQIVHKWTAAAIRRQIGDTAEPIAEIRIDAEKKKPTAFMEARDQLVRDSALLDSSKHPVIAHNQYVIDPEKRSSLEAAIIELREKHKDRIDEHDAEVKRVNEFLAEKVDLVLPTSRLKLSWFNDTVDPAALEILFDLIDMDIEPEALVDVKEDKKKG